MSHVALIDAELDRAKLTPRERIVRTLLEWYQDALEGWRTNGAHGERGNMPLAGRTWNHPSYQELERSRMRMRDAEPELYWHIAERFIRPSTQIALRCPRCQGVEEWPKRGHRQKSHKHGKRVELMRASVLVVSGAVVPALVVNGVRWLAVDFRGDPFVPDDITGE